MYRMLWAGMSHWFAGNSHKEAVFGEEEEHGPHSPELVIAYSLISVVLVVVAGLMSGLTIGLMSVDAIELEVLKRGGTPHEKKYASSIRPLLSNHHYLLCTLVLWNAAAMEALPLFLDRLVDPVTAVVLSVTVVLIFGEIVPQSICSRYGLAVGYYSAWAVRFLMFLAFPVAWPLGKLLDWVLGHGEPALPRGQLQQYIALHSEDEVYANVGEGLTKNELHVINSALELTCKTARTAMTPLDKVFMISQDETLDEKLLMTILKMGHSRVPVHVPGNRQDIVGLLLVKELLLKVKEPRPVSELQTRSLPSLSASMPMYDVLHLFKTGRAHMALLCEATADKKEEARIVLQKEHSTRARMLRIDSAGCNPPMARSNSPNSSSSFDLSTKPLLSEQTDSPMAISNAHSVVAHEHVSDTYINVTEGVPVGIITIEDVIEELIGDEIVDETDRFVDNLKTAAVNTSDITKTLPDNLKTLLQLGMFTPRVKPPRVRGTAGPGAATSADPGTPVSNAQNILNHGDLPTASGDADCSGTSPLRFDGALVQGSSAFDARPGDVIGVVRHGGSTTPSRSASTLPLQQENVVEALKKVEAALDSDPDVREAVGLLREATKTPSLQVGKSGSTGSTGGVGSSRVPSAMMLSSKGRTAANYAKGRAAQISAHEAAGSPTSASAHSIDM